MAVKVVSATLGVSRVVYSLMVVEQSCSWSVGRPRPVMVVLVVSTWRLLVMPDSWRCMGWWWCRWGRCCR